MQRFQVDTWCVYETNVDTTNSVAKHILHTTLRNQHSHLQFGSTPLPAPHLFKPGGTLIATVGSKLGRVIDQGTDYMGRWLYHILAGKQKTLTLISVSAKQTSILYQPARYLSPCKAFVHDLSRFIMTQQHAGSGILLLGNFNKPLTTELHGTLKLYSDCGLCDLYHSLIGHDSFGIFVEGTTRLDYVLWLDWVAEAVIGGFFKPFNFRVKGNHRAMVLDFDTCWLFGNKTLHLASLPRRDFSPKDITANRQYIKSKYAYLSAHRFSARLASLASHWDPAAAKLLDRNFQRTSIFAATQC